MKLPWFQRIGLLFYPKTIIGWFILIFFLAFLVYIFIDIDSQSHSVSDTLMNFIFNFIIITSIYSLVGIITSRSKREEHDLTKKQN